MKKKKMNVPECIYVVAWKKKKKKNIDVSIKKVEKKMKNVNIPVCLEVYEKQTVCGTNISH